MSAIPHHKATQSSRHVKHAEQIHNGNLPTRMTDVCGKEERPQPASSHSEFWQWRFHSWIAEQRPEYHHGQQQGSWQDPERGRQEQGRPDRSKQTAQGEAPGQVWQGCKKPAVQDDIKQTLAGMGNVPFAKVLDASNKSHFHLKGNNNYSQGICPAFASGL